MFTFYFFYYENISLKRQSNDKERAKNINNFRYDFPKNIGVNKIEVKIADIK